MRDFAIFDIIFLFINRIIYIIMSVCLLIVLFFVNISVIYVIRLHFYHNEHVMIVAT